MSIKRLDIIDNLVTLLKTITVLNGYYSNLSTAVYRFRSTPIATNEQPCINVRTAERNPATDEAENTTTSQNQYLDVLIDIYAADEETATEVLTDVLKAIGANIDAGTNLGGKAIDVMDLGDKMWVDHQGKREFEPQLQLRIHYRTRRFQEE